MTVKKRRFPRRYTGTQHGYLSLRRRSVKKARSIRNIDEALKRGKTKQGYLYSPEQLERMVFRRDRLSEQKRKLDKAKNALGVVVYNDQKASAQMKKKGKTRYAIKNVIKDDFMRKHHAYVKNLSKRG